MIRVLTIAIVALLVGLPGLALAKPRVAIVAFENDNSGELTDVVGELLDDEFSVVASSKVTRMLDKLGYDTDLTTKQLKKLSNELEVDALLRGDLKKKGKRKVLHVKLFVNGKKVRGFKVEFASVKSKKFKTALRNKLSEKLGGGEKSRDEDKDDDKDEDKDEDKDKDEDEDKGKGKGKKGKRIEPTVAEPDDKGDDEDEDRKKRKKSVAVDSEDDDEPIEGEVEDRAPASNNPHTINRAAVRVDMGMSLSRRQLSFTSRAFEEAPRPYANSPVPGGRLEADIYPLAFSNPNSIIAGLGIGGTYDQTLSLNLQSTVQPGTKFPVNQGHWSVGGRLRLVFGKKSTSPSVVVKGGYATRTFTVDRGQLMEGNVIDLPDVGYKGFTGGLDLRFPISGPVAVFAGGGGIFVTTTGQIQTRAQYGQAKVTGAEARAGVDIAIGKRMAIKVFGEFTQMGFAFTGTGEMSNNRDGDPSTIDVGGAADRYIGGSLLFGVLY